MQKKITEDNSKTALLWSFIERFGYQIINFFVILVLARFLEPLDFGIISILMSIIYILNVFMDGGFGTLIIQKKEINEKELSTIFYTNLSVGLLSYLLLVISSKSVGIFFLNSNLYKYINVISLVLVINSLGIVQFSLVERELEFKRLFIINMTSLLISSLVTIYLALVGYGVWSLIVFQLLNSALKVLIFYYVSNWRPKLIFDFILLKESWRFSRNILLSSLIDATYQKGINFFIGKISSTKDLGFYEQASKTKEVPTAAVVSSVRRVLFPLFSRQSDDFEKTKKDFRTGVALLAFIAIPLSFLFFLFSDFLVVVLFSKKWLASSYYFKILSFTIIPYMLYYINIDLFKVKGNSLMYMKINVITKSIGFLLITFFSFYGLKYALYSFVLIHWLSYILSCYYSKRNIGYPMNEQLRDLFPWFFYCLISLIIAKILFGFLAIENFYINNSLKLLCFLICYFFMIYTFCLKKIKEIFNFLLK